MIDDSINKRDLFRSYVLLLQDYYWYERLKKQIIIGCVNNRERREKETVGPKKTAEPRVGLKTHIVFCGNRSISALTPKLSAGQSYRGMPVRLVPDLNEDLTYANTTKKHH